MDAMPSKIKLAKKIIFMSNPSRNISFIIPAKNEDAYISKAIESILSQPQEFVKEIIVVDNSSTDNTAKIASSYPKVKVLSETISGTNITRQKGADAATGDIVAFVDSDNILPPDWSKKCVKYFNRPGVVAVSGPYKYYDQGWLGNFLSYNLFLVIAYPIYWFVHYLLNKGSVVLGGNMAMDREALKKVGGLDTRYKFFGDDANTGKKLRAVGKVIFTHRLFSLSSARRYKTHGYLKTTFLYFMNFVWVILFDKPFTKG